MEFDDPSVSPLNEGLRELRQALGRMDVGDEEILKNASVQIFKKNVVLRPMVFDTSEAASLADMSTDDGVANMEIATLIKNALGI